jgi:hypothetical protein
VYKLFRADTQLFEQPLDTSPDQDALGILEQNHAGNGDAFFSLIIVPGYQFVSMKLGLKLYYLLYLDHVLKKDSLSRSFKFSSSLL